MRRKGEEEYEWEGGEWEEPLPVTLVPLGTSRSTWDKSFVEAEGWVGAWNAESSFSS